MAEGRGAAPRAERRAAGRVLAGRLLGFGSLSVLGSASALLVLPLLSRRAGQDGWVAFGTGQAVGTLAAAVVMLGWNLVGQAEVAVAAPAGRPAVLARSLRVRLPLVLVCSPAASVLAAWLVPGERALAATTGLATAATGLAVGWYCIGEGSARRLLVFESGPKLLAALVSAVALALGASPQVYPATLLTAQLLAVVRLAHSVLRGSHEPLVVGPRRWWAEVCVAWHGSASVLLGTVAATLPVPLVTQLAGAAGAAGFVSADRLYRYALLVVVGLGNALAAWCAGSPRRVEVGRRLHLALGLVGGAALAALGPAVSGLLFGEHVRADPAVLAWQSLAFLALGVSTPLVRMVFGFADDWRPVLTSTLASGGVGALAMVAGGLLAGAPGVAAGLAAGEVLGAVTLLALRRRRRRRRPAPAAPAAPGGAPCALPTADAPDTADVPDTPGPFPPAHPEPTEVEGR